MAELRFNTPEGNAVERKTLMLFLNTGTYEEPIWSIIGRRVEDSSMEFDWGEEATTDVLGEVHTTYKPPVITQTFEPCELDSADAAQRKIWNQAIRRHDTGAMTNNDMLVVHSYIGNPKTGVYAERYLSSAVRPSGLGGSSYVGMPITVIYGGEREEGAATVINKVVTFTEGVKIDE